MSHELVYYNSNTLRDFNLKKYPDLRKFLHFFKIYSIYPIFDRTNTLKFPIKTKSLYEIPQFKLSHKSFEDICNERAKEILKFAEERNKNLYVFYSGGIDSTLMLVSLLKNGTNKQIKNIVVLLTEESIKENANFYRNHISGKLNVLSTTIFPRIMDDMGIFLTGEHNDHIFGSVWIQELMDIYGDEIIHKPYDTDIILNFFNKKDENIEYNKFWLELLEKIVAKAPVKIVSYFDFFWWVSMAIRWQGFVMYPLLCIAKGKEKVITEEFFRDNYFTFYGTDDFQLWSMNNMDKKIKEDWKSFKWVCKEIIYNFDGDAEYRDNKVKVSSMKKITTNMHDRHFIDGNFNFYKPLSIGEIYNKENDFK